MTGGGSFRSSVWDPWLIISQMAALQSAFYVSLGFWIYSLTSLAGYPKSLDLVFVYKALLASQPHGKLLIAAFILNSMTCSLALWQIVQRAKQCLDFTCTVHFFHIIFCWIYNGHLGNSFSWWVINGVCVALMCVTGEFLCMKTELKAIPVSLSGVRTEL